MKLDGQVAWITGAGSGIGAATAHSLAQGGARVVLSGRRAEPLEQVAADIRAAGGDADAATLDVTDAEAAQAVADDILARHGRIDILVANAGMNVAERSFAAVSMADWARIIDVNLTGVMHGVAAALPAMRAQRGGLVAMIASWAGRHPLPLSGGAYNASKHGVVALAHSLNQEEGRNGIRASAIMPGEVATEILDARPSPPSQAARALMLQAEDLGRVVRFVAESPPHVCLNEILVSPTHNRLFGNVDD